MALPHPVPEDLAELIARRFRALGEPLRVRLLDQLRGGELSVGELAARLGTSQQNASKHLATLVDVGLLARRKEGTYAYYRLADEEALALCEQVCGSLEAQLRSLAALVGSAARPTEGSSGAPVGTTIGTTTTAKENKRQWT